jgi:hypothetical protein
MAKIEENRLIVEFADGRPDKRPPIADDCFIFHRLGIPGSHHISEFKFHEDWNWLIRLMAEVKCKFEESDLDLFGDLAEDTWGIEDCLWNDEPKGAFEHVLRLIKEYNSEEDGE